MSFTAKRLNALLLLNIRCSFRCRPDWLDHRRERNSSVEREPNAARRVRMGKKGWLAVGVAALAVLIGVPVTVSQINSAHGPAAAVRDYVELVAQGKANEAN